MARLARGAISPASSISELFNEVSIALRESGPGAWAEYRGTRAQIEAEIVVPASAKWPAAGFNQISWTSGPVMYLLRRVRPIGAKGPRRDFAQIDLWSLRTVLEYSHSIARQVEFSQAEFQQILEDASPQGRIAAAARRSAADAAREDAGFQSFLAQIPGLKPAGRPQHARLSKGEAA